MRELREKRKQTRNKQTYNKLCKNNLKGNVIYQAENTEKYNLYK